MTDYVALVFTDLVNSTAVKDTMPGDTITKRNQAYRDNILFPHRKRVTESLINYGGRVVEPPQGDGYLLEFDDPVKAIEWAVFIQRSHEKEPIRTPSGSLKVKIGIHYGAPLRDGDRFIGQEVDYAARVSALAKGGQVLLSKTMAVLIEAAKIQNIKIDFLGEYELKGIGTVPISEIVYNEFKNFEREIKKSPYVERPPIEKNCYQNILQPGMLIRIKAPEKMGKSSLLNQILVYAKQQNYQTIRLDFQLLDDEMIKDSSQFLRWLCKKVSKQLKLADQVDDYWQGMTPNILCTDYFEECLLPNLNSPFVLGLDNVDRFFEEKYQVVAANFFGMLRSWWGNAQQTTDSDWQKLRLIVVYSTEDLPKLNIYQSPFNVGEEVKLSEFNRSQIQVLAQQYGLNLLSPQVEKLTELVGGHPYLLKVVFEHLKTDPNVILDELLIKAATNEGIYHNHLQEYWLNLDNDPELAVIFRKVVASDSPIQINSPKQFYKLESMGLITVDNNKVKPRCQLYRLYFREQLG
jgi:class 3 adenylate cyclase